MSNASLRSANTAKEITVDDLSAQIALLKEDISMLTMSLGDYSKNKTQDVASTAKETAANVAQAGRAKAVDIQSEAEEFVRTQPATALGIVAGVGFLVGLLTARR